MASLSAVVSSLRARSTFGSRCSLGGMSFQHVFVVGAHHFADSLAGLERFHHGGFAPHDKIGGFEHAVDFGLRDKNHGAAIGDDVISGMNGYVADCDGDIGSEFDDAAASGAA